MEGVPRMPMLSVELKFSAASTDFSEKILEYVAKVYQEDPNSYRKEVDELNNLRENATKAPADFAGCSLLKKYFAQLHLLKNRFAMEMNDDCAVAFTWYEKYSDMPNPVTYDDIRYEMACVLHNVGALHSYLGSIDSRMSSEGMKIACTHFQCAAWAFQNLRGNYNAASFCSDFDKNILAWHTNLMLAQAQECILEKSLIDNRKYNIIAKISIQVAEFYRDCIKCLEQQSVSDVVGSSRCKSWKKFVDMKVNYYSAIGYLYLGYQSEELQKTSKEQKMGERLAYFQAASDRLNEATKLSQKETDAVKQALQFTFEVISGKLTNAKKENDFIYHDKIPSLDSLPEIKGAVLVKSNPFDPLDIEISGQDIFQRLIPLGVHQASSLYSEEKATLLRHTVDKIDRRNEHLTQHLSALQLEQIHLDDDFLQLPLPETLMERCAAFSTKSDAVPDLLSTMQKLSTLYGEVEYAITELENQLNDAEKDLKSDEETYGKNAELTSLLTKLKELRNEFVSYREANVKATKSNTELHKAVAAHSDNLKVLALPVPELKKQLPMPATPGGQSAEGVELKRIIAKVEEMKQQRETLLDQLRKQVIGDDLTKILLANRDKDTKEIFEKELKKHDKLIGLIEQNLTAQDNILKALTEANAKYGKIRQETADIVKTREAKILSLVAAYDVYIDLIDKSKQGIEFYKKFQKTLIDFNEKMAKFGEQLNQVETNLQTKVEKHVAAASASAVPKSNVSATKETDGPKLKDYLAYYQAKKAGIPASFPPESYAAPSYPGVSTTGPQQHQLPASQQNAYSQQVPQSYSSNATTAYSQNQIPYSSTTVVTPNVVGYQQQQHQPFQNNQQQQQNGHIQQPAFVPQQVVSPNPSSVYGQGQQQFPNSSTSVVGQYGQHQQQQQQLPYSSYSQNQIPYSTLTVSNPAYQHQQQQFHQNQQHNGQVQYYSSQQPPVNSVSPAVSQHVAPQSQQIFSTTTVIPQNLPSMVIPQNQPVYSSNVIPQSQHPSTVTQPYASQSQQPQSIAPNCGYQQSQQQPPSVQSQPPSSIAPNYGYQQQNVHASQSQQPQSIVTNGGYQQPSQQQQPNVPSQQYFGQQAATQPNWAYQQQLPSQQYGMQQPGQQSTVVGGARPQNTIMDAPLAYHLPAPLQPTLIPTTLTTP